jgi:hypothetical protein
MKSVMVPLAVASDRSESVAFSEQRLVNMFPEKAQFGGKSPFVLLWAPALKPLGPGVGTGPWRGGIVMDGVLYIVSGGTMYSVNGAGIGISLGAIDGSGYVSMATVGTQICVATSAGHGFHYDSSTGTLQQIADVDFFGGTSVCSLDGYFIWSSGGATPTRFQWSALLNGLLYDALDFASAESTATELIRAYLVGSQIFMMKPDRIEIWFDGGLQDSPFERMSSTIIPKGVAAKFSPACWTTRFSGWVRTMRRAEGPLSTALTAMCRKSSPRPQWRGPLPISVIWILSAASRTSRTTTPFTASCSPAETPGGSMSRWVSGMSARPMDTCAGSVMA